MITHGDCLEDAEYLAGLVREKMGIQDILINNIGTDDRKPYRSGRTGVVLYGK